MHVAKEKPGGRGGGGGGFPKLGVPLGPHNEESGMLGFMLGSPVMETSYLHLILKPNRVTSLESVHSLRKET